MERIVHQVVCVEADERNTHTLLVNVTAGGRDFWECYVGVEKGDVFYTNEPFISDRYKIWQVIEKKAFLYYGASATIQDRNSEPLQGAWLSFARLGTTYDFLDDKLFYYSAGFCYSNGFSKCTFDACYDAALIQADRINNVIYKNQKEEYRAGTYISKVEALEILKKSIYWDKKLVTLFHDSNFEPKTLAELYEPNKMITLYEFNKSTQSVVYMVGNFNIFIDCFGNIFQKTMKDYGYMYEVFFEDQLAEAIHYTVRRGSITLDQKFFFMNKMTKYLKPEHHAHKYWIKVMGICSQRKLNKHDANNLLELLKILDLKKEGTHNDNA